MTVHATVGVRDGSSGPELRLEGRQRDVDHGDVEDRHDRAQHHHAGDLENGAVDVVGVLRLLALSGHAVSRSEVLVSPKVLVEPASGR